MMNSLAAQIIDQQVSGIVEKHADVLAGDLRLGSDQAKLRSAAFVFLVARTAFDLADQDALDGIVDGANDFGVDALYFDPPDGGELPIVLIQGKYRTSRDAAFPENGIAQMIDAIDVLFDPERPVTLNRRLTERVEEIRSLVKEGAIPRVTAVAANNGARWTAQAQQRIDNAPEDFREQVTWRYLGAKELVGLLRAPKKIDAELQLIGQATVETFSFRRALTGRMSVVELARLADRYDNHLFERNIRRYLGFAGHQVNDVVAATLRSQDERPNFYFYNNGVTIVCSKFRHNALQRENWSVRVDGMQIVNGGQTARTVQQVAHEIGPDNIAEAEVLVRIYEMDRDDDNLGEAITIATNRQTPAILHDQWANEQSLAMSISRLGYRYRTTCGNREVLADEFTSTEVAEAVLAAWRLRPYQARFRTRDHFGALYDTIFTKDLNGAQAVVAALLLRTAEARRRNAPDDAPEFLAYGTRFITMLMGRYLLDEMGITIDRLDLHNFMQARQLIVRQSDRYLSRAEHRIDDALERLFAGRHRMLQLMSTAFRRADLVDLLLWDAEAEAMNGQPAVSKIALAAFCREHGIKRLAIFGSALRDDFGPESDVDLLVEFQPDRIPGLLGIAGMEMALSGLFDGRKVDLRTPEDLSPYFRQDVLAVAEDQYVQE